MINIVNEAERALSKEFAQIDSIAEFNTKKVLDAFYKNKIGEEHFYTVTGYGHDDLGREALDKVFADAFCAEAAIVRPHFVSGTHTLSCALFGLLHYGDHLLSIAGAPYDTLEEAIGKRKNDIYHESSLIGHGVEYSEVPLKYEFEVDFEKIPDYIRLNTKMVLIQKSRGYSLRKSLSLDDISRIVEIIKGQNPNIICFVDNCYGEFTDIKEPIEAGADIMAGSLIKNPGGGIVEAGGYIAGKERLVELCSRHLTSPGIGRGGGAMHNTTRVILQGFFMAPSIVANALKGAVLAARVFEMTGFQTHPHSNEKRADLIQTIKFACSAEQEKFCKVLQRFSPVESYLTPIPNAVLGYDCKLIMAGGSFIEGSTIELSADGPVRPPYAVYMQGGLSYYHVKIALIGILEELKVKV